MEKVDVKKELKTLYQPPAGKVVRVDVPAMNFLMIDGEGDPNTSVQFQDGAAALFSLSYAIKFMVKKSPRAVDYGVMPLEGLWWADDMSAFAAGNKASWKWTLMIMQPRYTTKDLFAAALSEVGKKKGLAALSQVCYREFSEGTAAQTMHIGPFSEEGPTVPACPCIHRGMRLPAFRKAS
jgi:hypothetical protein